MTFHWRAIWAYLTWGMTWKRQVPGDPWLRRLLGVTSVHTRLRSLHILQEMAKVRPFPRSVVELGFGEGHLLLWLARHHPDTRFEGWELDTSLVARARSRANSLGLTNITFNSGEFAADRAVPRFDLIYCVDVLEHVPEDQALLAALARSLHPDGLFIMHVPQRRSRQQRFFSRFHRHAEPGHVREEYTVSELVPKVMAAGLEIIRIEETFGPAGELAFEINSLGWPHPVADRVIRTLSLPVTLPLGLLDLALARKWGNSLLLVAHKDKKSG